MPALGIEFRHRARVDPSPDRENLKRLAVMLRAVDAEVDGTGDFDPGELPDPLDPDVLAQGGNLPAVCGRVGWASPSGARRTLVRARDSGWRGAQRSPVRSRRCPATVRLPKGR
jgi:hypothetical protein